MKTIKVSQDRENLDWFSWSIISISSPRRVLSTARTHSVAQCQCLKIPAQTRHHKPLPQSPSMSRGFKLLCCLCLLIQHPNKRSFMHCPSLSTMQHSLHPTLNDRNQFSCLPCWPSSICLRRFTLLAKSVPRSSHITQIIHGYTWIYMVSVILMQTVLRNRASPSPSPPMKGNAWQCCSGVSQKHSRVSNRNMIEPSGTFESIWEICILD